MFKDVNRGHPVRSFGKIRDDMALGRFYSIIVQFASYASYSDITRRQPSLKTTLVRQTNFNPAIS